MPALLDVRDLRTHFGPSSGGVRAVDGVSFDVQPGETLALVGESGCGKSVTALSIMRLIPTPPGRIEGGQVFFDGRDLLALPEEPMTSLNPVLTIGLQITETMEHHLGLSPAQARARAVELLGLVGIPEPERRLAQHPHQFSGGMRQRVMIAIALSCRPRLVLADEPTTALDVTIQAQILDLLKRLSREFGVAMVIITHNLGVVARYADRVNVMYAGRIVERARARELYERPRHPYTLGLLRSVPRLDRPRAERLDPIAGQPPDLAHLPRGCSFQPRCRFAYERCEREAPPLVEAERGRLAACFRSAELPAPEVA